jgi:hypothetical protein
LNEWVISLVAALAAVGALVFTGYSFKRLRKTEQVRLSESILKDVRNSINEYNIPLLRPFQIQSIVYVIENA